MIGWLEIHENKDRIRIGWLENHKNKDKIRIGSLKKPLRIRIE